MLKKIQKITLFILVLYALLGFFALPYLLKPKIVEIVQEQTNAKISIEHISFNPFIFKLHISGIKLTTVDNKDLLRLKSLLLNVEVYSLAASAIHISEFILEEPELSLVYREDKSLNLSEIIKQTEEAPQEQMGGQRSKIPRIILDRVAIERGTLNYEDFTRQSKFDFSFNRIGFELKDIDTEDFNASDATLRFYSSLDDGGFVDLKSDIIGLKPFIIKGSLDFEASKLYTQWKYMKESLNLEVADGKLSFNTEYYFNMDDLNAITIYNLNASLDNLRLKPKEKYKDILNLGSFYIQEATIKPMVKDIYVKKIGLDSLYLKASRDSDAKLDWIEYIKTEKEDESAEADSAEQNSSVAKKESSGMWKVKVDEIGLQEIKVDFEDRVLEPSVTTSFDRISFNAYNLDSKEYSWLSYDLALRVNAKGWVKSKGRVRHTPLKQEGSFELEKISLTELTPYIQESAFIKIDDGYLNLKSRVKFSNSIKNPDLEVQGSLNLKNLFVTESRDSSALASIGNLGVNSFTLELSPNRLFIEEVDLNSFYLNALIDREKKMNFASLAKPKEDAVVKKGDRDTHSTKEESPFPIKIMKLNISDGSAKFGDFSLPIPFRTNIHNLNGLVSAISNVPGETSYIDIKGKVDRYGSTELKGSINAGNPKEYMDLDLNFRNLELSSASGYSASFAGHTIASGKLFLDLGYKILDSELLARNSIVIKNMKLGEELKDEKRSPLPLAFVIALLEDAQGVVDIDMPVKGNVDAPDFKYSALLLKTLSKMITEAATSPFRFLGRVLGVDGEALGYAEFEAGLSNLLLSEQEKLDNIAKIMAKRPKITLLIVPSYDVEVDKSALQEQKLATKKEAKELQSVSQEELKALAISRGAVLQSYLVNKKNINSQRVKLLESARVKAKNENLVRSKLAIEVK